MSDKQPENNEKSIDSPSKAGRKRVREQKDARLKQALRKNLRRRKLKTDSPES